MAGADDLSLSQSYFPLTVTTTVSTPPASPLGTFVNVPPSLLLETYVLIPRGHAGQTGVRIVYSGQVIVPFGGASADQWLIGDDTELVLPTSFPVANHLLVQTYNTGIFAHQHFLRFKVDYNAVSDAGSRPALSIVPVA